jgi:hypothetical protein
LKAISIAGVVLLLAATRGALALTGAELAGNWIVSWQPDNTRNALYLSERNGRLAGTYLNDERASCSVTGNIRSLDRRISLQIVCPKWDIRMNGVAAPDGRTVTGSYEAYIEVAGKFSMVRR